MSLKNEIFQQPQVLSTLLENQRGNIETVAHAIQKRGIDYVFLAARGTSDNAGLYAKYLLGAFNQLPIALATPSLFTMYGAPPRLTNALVLGISQSGASQDIVSVLEEGRQQGALTLAITNAPNSPLAHAADHVIDIQAGEEKAVAATKSFTAQLMAVAMLSAGLSQDAKRFKALQAIPDAVVQALSLDSFIEQSVERYRYMEQCVVLGRGFNYATAYEWSLKLKELTYVVAEPYSSADFQHGPIAIVERGFPVLAVLPSGCVFDDMVELVRRLAEKSGAELVIISDRDEALTLAQTPLKLPESVSEWMSPLVSIVPGQLFAYYLRRAKGYKAEHPRGLRKITLTR